VVFFFLIITFNIEELKAISHSELIRQVKNKTNFSLTFLLFSFVHSFVLTFFISFFLALVSAPAGENVLLRPYHISAPRKFDPLVDGIFICYIISS
jgi:hypothetical protein